jgi:hypothetical protein
MLDDWLRKLAPGELEGMKDNTPPPRFCWPCTIIGLATLAGLVGLTYWLLRLLLA